MELTRSSVIENASDNPNEVLVVFVEPGGQLHNVLLRDAAVLKAALVATPRVIVNPDRAPLDEQAFAAAEALIAANEAPSGDEEPTP